MERSEARRAVEAVEVRDAVPTDAAALSRVHSLTWEATYVGQVPDALAHDRIAQARDRDWAKHYELRVGLGGGVLVLVHGGDVIGFCEYGPTEDPDEDARRIGHIMRIYVLPGHQGRGAAAFSWRPAALASPRAAMRTSRCGLRRPRRTSRTASIDGSAGPARRQPRMTKSVTD